MEYTTPPQFGPEHYTDEVMQILRTAIAISPDGKQIDYEMLISDLMKDYGWSEEHAEGAIEYAEYLGAIWFGCPSGSLPS